MTPFGTYYYPPCAGTGGFLFTNPPFKMTDQPIVPGLPGLSEEDCVKLSVESGYGPRSGARLTRAAYQRGADDQLEACAEWLRSHGWPVCSTRLRDAMRPKPPSLKEQSLAIVADCCTLTPAQKDTLRRALEALPE